jgi:hypothetical protein
LFYKLNKNNSFDDFFVKIEELAKIKQTNTIERPERSTVFWKQKIRPVWTERRGIPLPGAADLA